MTRITSFCPARRAPCLVILPDRAADSFPSDRRTNLQKDRRAPDRIAARAMRTEEAVAMTKP
jgi:hypothetical protein